MQIALATDTRAYPSNPIPSGALYVDGVLALAGLDLLQPRPTLGFSRYSQARWS
jgi:hypothetical protein